MIRRLGFLWRADIFSFIISPLLHGVAHRKNLSLEGRARGANGHVKAKRDTVLPRQFAVFLRNHKRSDFFAGSLEEHHEMLGFENQFNSRHSRNLRRARCS